MEIREIYSYSSNISTADYKIKQTCQIFRNVTLYHFILLFTNECIHFCNYVSLKARSDLLSTFDSLNLKTDYLLKTSIK